MDDHLLDPQEMADRLHVPLSWIYSETRRREPDAIPVIRVGKYCRFVESEVMAWLKSRQRSGNGKPGRFPPRPIGRPNDEKKSKESSCKR